MDYQILKYRDLDDKCYGLTGMAISIVALDAESLLDSLSLDAEPGEGVTFTPDFYFSGNPRLSARIAWKQILEHYRLSSAMLIANIMCREYVRYSRAIKDEARKLILQLITEEGLESCSLEEDEAKQLFDNTFNYLHRLFAHHGVQSVARDFADTLKRERTLSRHDVIEHLRQLSFL